MATTAPPPLKMQYRFMGKTGLKVSELCFGAMTIGESSVWKIPTASEEDLAFKMMNRFVEAGGNFFDTADVYGLGSSEMVLGKWLKTQKREDMVIATKSCGPMGQGPNDVGVSRKHILSAVDASLKRLQVDYIDLYQIHAFDHGTPLEETLSTLNDLVRSRKVRYIGASNFNGVQLQKAVLISKYMGFEPFTCLQPQYSLLERHIEWDMVPLCQDEGLGVLPWSPLKGGWLTGKVTRDKKPEAGSRIEWAEKSGWQETNFTKFATDRTWNIIDTVLEIAKARNKAAASVSLRWVIQRPGITAPIIGARTMEQLEDNLNSVGWSLSDAEMKKLDDISALPLEYPWNMASVPRDPSRVH